MQILPVLFLQFASIVAEVNLNLQSSGLVFPFDANIEYPSLSEAKLTRSVRSNEINTLPVVERAT